MNEIGVNTEVFEDLNNIKVISEEELENFFEGFFSYQIGEANRRSEVLTKVLLSELRSFISSDDPIERAAIVFKDLPAAEETICFLDELSKTEYEFAHRFAELNEKDFVEKRRAQRGIY